MDNFFLDERFTRVRSKNSSREALEKWRNLCSIVKNPKRRFRFTANLSKRDEAADAMRRTNQKIDLINPPEVHHDGQHSNMFVKVWRLMGFGSSITGFICFALGPSFQKLFGRWNLLKIVVYCILSSMFSLFILSANRFRLRLPSVFLLKVLVSFLVLLFTSLYSYNDDLAGNKDGETEGKGYRNILSLISFGSFALMSMSLSLQLQPGFEVGMSNFFLGCLVLGVMKKNLLEGLGVALLCFIVMSIRSYSDFRQEQRRRGGVELEDIAVVGDGFFGEKPQI